MPFLLLPHLFRSTEMLWGSYSMKCHFDETLPLKDACSVRCSFYFFNINVYIILIISL